MAKPHMHEPAEEARLSAAPRGGEARPAAAVQRAGEVPDAPRRPSPVEYRPWRGDGIVGDLHTD